MFDVAGASGPTSPGGSPQDHDGPVADDGPASGQLDAGRPARYGAGVDAPTIVLASGLASVDGRGAAAGSPSDDATATDGEATAVDADEGAAAGDEPGGSPVTGDHPGTADGAGHDAKTGEEPLPRAAHDARRAKVLRFVVAPVILLLAALSGVLGALNATVWKPSPNVEATATVTGAPYLLADPGVLDLVSDKPTVTVSGSGRVCAAVASAADAQGWMNGAEYARVTGLDDWSTLSTATARSTVRVDEADIPKDDPAVDFSDSDMWRSVECGSGSVTVKPEVSGIGDTLLVSLGGSGSAKVTIGWVRSQVPDFAMPFWFMTVLLLVLSVMTATLFAAPPRRKRADAESPEPTPVRAWTGGAGTHGDGPDHDGPVILEPARRNIVEETQAMAAAGTAGNAAADSASLADYLRRVTEETDDDEDGDGIGGRPMTRRERRMAAKKAGRRAKRTAKRDQEPPADDAPATDAPSLDGHADDADAAERTASRDTAGDQRPTAPAPGPQPIDAKPERPGVGDNDGDEDNPFSSYTPPTVDAPWGLPGTLAWHDGDAKGNEDDTDKEADE